MFILSIFFILYFNFKLLTSLFYFYCPFLCFFILFSTSFWPACCCYKWISMMCGLIMFFLSITICSWPRKPWLPFCHLWLRRVKATTAPSASRRGRQRASTGCPLCAADISSATPASSAGWKLRVQPLNVHRSVRSLYFNRSHRPCKYIQFQQKSISLLRPI